MTPHTRLLAALDAAREAAEQQQIALEQMDLALQVTDLERLIVEASRVTRRDGSDSYYPHLSLGHLDEDRFEALCQLLEATPDEVKRDTHADGCSYLMVTARRQGVWFYAQRSVLRLTVVDTLAGVDPMVSP